MDGSLTNGKIDNVIRSRATVVVSLNYILDEPGCVQTANASTWDNVAVCNQNVTVRKVTFMNILPNVYANYFPPTVWRMPKQSTESSRSTLLKTSIGFSEVNSEIKNSWSSAFVLGSTYKIQHDFNLQHVDVQTSPLMTTTDNGIIFKFIYTSSYELYEVYKKKNGLLGSPLVKKDVQLAHAACKNGDYFHNNSIKEFQICSSGRDLALYELIDINPIFCRNDCPKPPVIVVPVTPPPVIVTPVTPPPPVIDYNICVR